MTSRFVLKKNMKSQAKTYIQIAKEKYISNNLESLYNDTFSSNILKELSIE